MLSKENFIKSLASYLRFQNDYDSILLFEDEIRSNLNIDANFILNESSDENYMVKESGENSPDVLPGWKTSSSIEELNEKICNCTKCDLGNTRKNFVFGSGNPQADIVVVGEAPGADEDEKGLPFIGRAGQLLTKILEAINLSRDEVFICNILKCRPPGNRNPSPEEIEKCEPYLKKQLDLIKPKLILALGTFASQTLLQTKQPLGKLRGEFHDYNGIKTMVTFHPAALLRNPNWKKPTWEDVQLLRKEYDKLLNNGL